MSTVPALPLSLSPHICVLPSPDLEELLTSSALPPLQRLLQSFSPLPQVITRTTALAPVSHATFPLRFSHLHDVEAACKEDEDARAGRTIDWMGQRIAKRAAAWVDHAERDGNIEVNGTKTPWWEELRRCTEGDRTPTRTEGWNHPVAVILAVSTLAPNPLQAVTDLQSRHIDLPPWVDPTALRHTLIIHTANSPLTGDEAMALFNATKKQYGLHSHLLTLTLSAPTNPVSVPPLLPELPPTPIRDASFSKAEPQDTAHLLNLVEKDIAQFARFVREFVTMSLVPWMERCVLDWNETYSSNRRLPSRLFSSTRRLFGGSGNSNHVSSSSVHAPVHHPSTPTSPTSTNTTFAGPPPQQRRLAEFATFLGDIKLAVSVWESLRKEGRGGSEVLPLLLAPSPALGEHASHALSTLQNSGAGPSSQLRALVYAVRWGTGVRDLPSLGGERWLEWAAGLTEEPPPALLLAHAALLCARKGATRRAAMWYVFAAHRLEKCGIRPLTVYFLRKSRELFRVKPPKNLSPSFTDSHYLHNKDVDGFDAILPSIEYSLGRLMYTSGDTEGALRYFLGLLRGSTQLHDVSETDPLYIGDFKVAFEHLKSTLGTMSLPVDLALPFAFSRAAETKVRLVRQGELDVDAARWAALEAAWRGRGNLEKGGRAVVGERLWVDVMVLNPLDVEVVLADFTVKAEAAAKGASGSDLDIEVIDSVILRAKESRVIPVSIISHKPCSLKITHLSYVFLSLLPITEALSVRGQRLHQSPAQLQTVTYGPDAQLRIDVEDGGRRLDLTLDGPNTGTVLGAGECLSMWLNVRNTGRGSVDDIWIVHSAGVWVDLEKDSTASDSIRTSGVFKSDNTLSIAPPVVIPLASLHTSAFLAPDESLDLRVVVHAQNTGSHEIAILLIFRETGQSTFYSTRLHRTFDVVPFINVGASARPSASSQASYVVNVEVENIIDGKEVKISNIATASATWACSSIIPWPLCGMTELPSLQAGRVLLKAEKWSEGSGSAETREFVRRQLGNVIHGRAVERSEPPPLEILLSYIAEPAEPISACDVKLLESARRTSTLCGLADRFYQLPQHSLPSIFPLRNPQALDIVVSWEIPSERRRGHILTPGLLLGASHAPLDGIIQESESAKVKRTMFAETTKERGEILEAVRASDWNANMDPAVVRVVSAPRIEHDFSRGHCIVPVTFIVRNFSLTNHMRFVLRLQSADSFRSSEVQHLPPCYTGALTRRGALAPLCSVGIKAKMWTTRPGIYGLSGWQLETSVGELIPEPWRTRMTFNQGPPVGEESIVTVVQRPS